MPDERPDVKCPDCGHTMDDFKKTHHCGWCGKDIPREHPIVERPTEFMEKVKKAHRSMQLWDERDTLQLVEYTEVIEGEVERLKALSIVLAIEIGNVGVR